MAIRLGRLGVHSGAAIHLPSPAPAQAIQALLPAATRLHNRTRPGRKVRPAARAVVIPSPLVRLPRTPRRVSRKTCGVVIRFHRQARHQVIPASRAVAIHSQIRVPTNPQKNVAAIRSRTRVPMNLPQNAAEIRLPSQVRRLMRPNRKTVVVRRTPQSTIRLTVAVTSRPMLAALLV